MYLNFIKRMFYLFPFTYMYNNYQLSLIVIYSWTLRKVQATGIMVARITTCVNRKVNQKKLNSIQEETSETQFSFSNDHLMSYVIQDQFLNFEAK